MLDEATPLFMQIAERVSEEIADGLRTEGQRAPSSNELAIQYRVNPATAAKGLNLLIDQGLLEKRRGIGMFVAAGARERLLAAGRLRFGRKYVEPMVAEAGRLGMPTDELVALILEFAGAVGLPASKGSVTA